MCMRSSRATPSLLLSSFCGYGYTYSAGQTDTLFLNFYLVIDDVFLLKILLYEVKFSKKTSSCTMWGVPDSTKVASSFKWSTTCNHTQVEAKTISAHMPSKNSCV